MFTNPASPLTPNDIKITAYDDEEGDTITAVTYLKTGDNRDEVLHHIVTTGPTVVTPQILRELADRIQAHTEDTQ